MKVLLFLLLVVCLVCINCQSPNNKGDTCDGPPTCQCNYGNSDSLISLPSNPNMKQGRPGKAGAPGQTGSVGPKGQKGDPGTSENLEEELREAKKQVQELMEWRIDSSKNCYELANLGFNTSGVYNITVLGGKTTVYCDMETDGGGWTVIQRRSSKVGDFYRGWNEYKIGFGDKTGNFWQGLETIYRMTSFGFYQLRVDIEDFENNTAYALYRSFSVGNEVDKYRLSVSGFSGNAGDSLSYHNNQRFSTKDQDHDSSGGNCAVSDHGAWWYNACQYSNFNGVYLKGRSGTRYMTWYHWKNAYYSLKRSEMKIKPT